MDLWSWLFCGYGVLMALVGYLFVYFAYRTIRGVPSVSLETFDAPEPKDWPLLSILIPACNEAEGIESAMLSLLQEKYPCVEIIAINDRSTDQTGDILDRLATDNPMLTVEHIKELPKAWLGKVHALYRGYQRAKGEWILLADADVHMTPGTMRRIIANCIHHRTDHFTLLPRIWRSDLLADIAWGSGFLGLVGQKLWEVPDPNSKAHVGAGAFNLLRRKAFEETPGFPWFKLDVADDWAVGLLMKSQGKRCVVANAVNAVHLPWYNSFSQMVSGMEKNSFAIIGRYSLMRCVMICFMLLLMFVCPLAFLAPFFSYSWILGAVWYSGMAIAGIMMHHWLQRPVWLALCFPLGAVLQSYIVLRAGIRGWRRGGVEWRGTFYPKEQMLNEMKVLF